MSEDGAEVGQGKKADDVKRAFEVFSGGVNKVTQNKLTDYTLAALRGESFDAPNQKWRDEIIKRVEAIRKIEDEKSVWVELQDRVQSTSSFDKKAFEYAWKIINGADKQEVLQGLPETMKGRVDTYMNETFNLAVQRVSQNEQ